MPQRAITLRYAGTCCRCNRALDVGTQAVWLGRGRVACSCCPARTRAQLLAEARDWAKAGLRRDQISDIMLRGYRVR